MECKEDSRPALSAARRIAISGGLKAPKQVLQVCQKLAEGSHKAWLAGGCVRDTLLGREPKDWDIVTDAPVDRIKALFPDHLDVGAAFGIIKLKPQGPKSAPLQVDIGIFRKESGYSDRRHPDIVEIGDENTDSQRRDFTVNAMYIDASSQEIVDYVNGHKDLGSKVIRAVGDASTRFEEDALRLLRAVRFSAQLGFRLEKATAAAIKKNAVLLREISRERIREELFKLLATSRPISGLENIAQYGLWEPVFGIKKVSIPADLRQLKLSWTPTPLHWVCALAVTGLLGDPQKEPDKILDRATECLRLSNHERTLLSTGLSVYKDCNRANPELTTHSPLVWIVLAREDKTLVDLLKSFVRRARGPSENEKSACIALLDQSVRWASKNVSEKQIPTAQTLLSEGFREGPKLGAELRKRQWESFWALKP